MDSLDPRINRLERVDELDPKKDMDQLGTFEVFVQQKLGKPYRHEGIVHSSDEEMAFLFAKEQFSRRMTCTGLWVVSTSEVLVSAMTEDQDNAYGHFTPQRSENGTEFDVFHLLKRGKQHVHAGSVRAEGSNEAFAAAAAEYGEQMVYNIWIIPSDKILRIEEEDRDIWDTLPEKKFRDALAYRAGDKLKEFLEKNRS